MVAWDGHIITATFSLPPAGSSWASCHDVLYHNSLRDVFAQFCHRARLGGQLEVGHGHGAESSLSRPADILVPNWMIRNPAAFDLTVVSPLNSTTLNEVGARSGSAAGKAEVCKHNANDAKCAELGWVCTPLAIETYGCWGAEAQGSISRLAARLALQQVKGHYKHLPEAEPHPGSLQCQSLAIPC